MTEDIGHAIQDLFQQLSEPLPDEAYQVDDSRGFVLTGIKGAYVVERLNQVFGLCGHGWYYTVPEIQTVEGIVLAHLELFWSFNGNWSQPIFAAGGQRILKGRIGDAEKGAITDALKKAASMIGVGHMCYKGQVTLPAPGNKHPLPVGKPTKHWIDDDQVRRRFWAWAKGTLGLTEDQIHQALKVKSVKDFKGTMSAAKGILEAFAIDKEGA